MMALTTDAILSHDDFVERLQLWSHLKKAPAGSLPTGVELVILQSRYRFDLALPIRTSSGRVQEPQHLSTMQHTHAPIPSQLRCTHRTSPTDGLHEDLRHSRNSNDLEIRTPIGRQVRRSLFQWRSTRQSTKIFKGMKVASLFRRIRR